MSCPCESYQLLLFDPCIDPITFWDLLADETDTWTAFIEFNGMWKCELKLPVVDGQPVQMPNVLNEDYVHEMRLYRSDGTLVGCFWLSTDPKTFPCHRIVDEQGNPISDELDFQLITG